MLSVEGFGDYTVEWHMAGDLKTLKCMYNMKHGATVASPCLYCVAGAESLESLQWTRAPNRHLRDKSFMPVLDIPLSRVHICTLHALCRIIEKVVHLYICFAWTLKPEIESKRVIKAIEGVLSDIGLHGGNVKIEEDPKMSQGRYKVPRKASIGGVKARRFLGFSLKDSDREEKRNMFNKWKQLHKVVKDNAGGGTIQNHKAVVWKSLDKIFHYLEQHSMDESKVQALQEALLDWKKSYLAGWGGQHITHYMVSSYSPYKIRFRTILTFCFVSMQHILFNHSPYFAKTYGSLSIWSTQGMEKTHYMARTGYFKHTRHGGGKDRANSLLELHQWTYRRLIHRARQKELLKHSEITRLLQHIHKEKRQRAWEDSTARELHANWRQSRVRSGKRWARTRTSS